MSSSKQSSKLTGGNLLLASAMLVCVGAWARVLHTHFTAPSPARYTEFCTADGPIHPPAWPHCNSMRIVIDAQIWQHCDATEGAPAGFVRFDLASGRADLLWPTKDVPSSLLLGGVQAPDGGLIVAAPTSPPQTVLWHLHPGGGIEPIGEVPSNLLALRIEGGQLEAVTAARPDQPMHHRRSLPDGPWSATPLPELPRLQRADGDPYRFAAVDAASHGTDGWTLWGVRQGADGTTAELWRCPPGGTWALESLVEHGFGDHQRNTRLDRSIDGVTSPYLFGEDLQILGRGEANRWAPIELTPPGVARSPLGGNRSDLRLTAHGSERLGHWRGAGGVFTQVGPRWMGLRERPDGVYAIDGATPDRLGKPLSREGWLASDGIFVPRPGGYAVLGTFGSYVVVDENLSRTDHPGLFGRIAAHFAHFRRFAWYNDTWRDYAPLKMATLPILLVGLPIFLLPGLVRRRRPSPRAAALWSLLAICFAWHFWYFTAPRWF